MVDGSDTQSKVDLLALTFALIGKYATMYRSLDGFVELFEPAAEILEAMKSDKFSETLKVRSDPTYAHEDFRKFLLGLA